MDDSEPNKAGSIEAITSGSTGSIIDSAFAPTGSRGTITSTGSHSELGPVGSNGTIQTARDFGSGGTQSQNQGQDNQDELTSIGSNSPNNGSLEKIESPNQVNSPQLAGLIINQAPSNQLGQGQPGLQGPVPMTRFVSKVPGTGPCCSCMTLEMGAKVVGIVDCIFSVIGLIVSISLLSEINSGKMKFVENGEVLFILSIISSVVGIIASILLIVGASNRNRILCLIWIVVKVITDIVFEIIRIIILSMSEKEIEPDHNNNHNKDEKTLSPELILALQIGRVLLYIYFVVVVVYFVQELNQGNNNNNAGHGQVELQFMSSQVPSTVNSSVVMTPGSGGDARSKSDLPPPPYYQVPGKSYPVVPGYGV